jgi:large subunit ribosomal protein L28
MARFCAICGKGPQKGNFVLRSGKPKRIGGIGTHVTAITKRRFFPNLQHVRARVNGAVKTLRVCTSCLKAGKVLKA